MLDKQWTIEYPGISFTLGSNPTLSPQGQRVVHITKAPTIGDPTLQTDDSEKPRSDGISFGQDFRGGRLITFEVGVLGSSYNDALLLSAELLRAWRGDTVRNTPGAVATLCTSNLGRLRQVYGRPRRCDVTDTQPVSQWRPGTADFQTADDLFYDPTPGSLTLPIVPPTSGGFTAPFTAPFSTNTANTTFGSILVGGDEDTFPVITIRGPILNPRVELINEWVLATTISLGVGQSVVLDCRPWAQTVLTNAGASLAGKFTRTSKMEKASLTPGSHVVSLKGIDATGTANMTFAWNNAYVSM